MPSNLQHDFKKARSFAARKADSENIMHKHPDTVPIVAEQSAKNDLPYMKSNFLVSNKVTWGGFLFHLRRRMKLKPEQGIFAYINDELPPTAALMSDVYQQQRDADGFLYICYSLENTFGDKEAGTEATLSGFAFSGEVFYEI